MKRSLFLFLVLSFVAGSRAQNPFLEKNNKASWIESPVNEDKQHRPVHSFRRDFNIKVKPVSAVLYITAHGLYEAEINGARVGKDYLTPGWTAYKKRLQYQQYDVLDLIKNGNNAIGVSVGRGWYLTPLSWSPNPVKLETKPAILAQLIIKYNNGVVQTINTDAGWKTYTDGPIISSEIFDGELYDANREINKWSKPGFDDSKWLSADVRSYNFDNLVASISEPVQQTEKLTPVKVFTTPEGDQVVDFGQNMVGWVELNYKGEKNETVIIRHAEVLDRNGNFYTANLRSAKQTNIYITDGKKTKYHPHFTFQGFRYISVKGIKSLKPEYFTGIVVHSNLAITGRFNCSDSLVNRLQENIVWGQKGNFVDIPSDCPQRDERLGWTGDAQIFFRTAAFNMDVRRFFEKWMLDVEAEQYEDGLVPAVVPGVFGNFMAGGAGWGDVATIIPWEMFRVYGDTALLRRQYPIMKKWVGYLDKNSHNNLRDKAFQFGDWLYYQSTDLMDGENAVTDERLISQAFYGYSVDLILKAATVLGYNEDKSHYAALLPDVRAAFLREFVTPSGRLVSNTQTAYTLALQFDLLPESQRSNAAERLVENIIDNKYHLTTGFLGTPYLCHVLSKFGYNAVAYKLLLQDTYPSWLYPVKKGATTIWERWDGIKPDGSFQDPMVNSFNHYSYGAVGDWMYRVVAGIDLLEPGYKKISIHPQPDSLLQFANAELQTHYGKIYSGWERKEGSIHLKIIIPDNTTADIIFPGTKKTVGPGTYTYSYNE
ncbi:MAG: family 78 glycoside hydrolase catalytic domain [Chitinophagaceae bacterium]|nr:family 78 glycoside hydrolase catalytic domain [Chitinophagaceae bacterium]